MPLGTLSSKPQGRGQPQAGCCLLPHRGTQGRPPATPADCGVGSLGRRCNLEEMDGLVFFPSSLIVSAGYKIFLFS